MRCRRWRSPKNAQKRPKILEGSKGKSQGKAETSMMVLVANHQPFKRWASAGLVYKLGGKLGRKLGG
jgi:hypothetical protein